MAGTVPLPVASVEMAHLATIRLAYVMVVLQDMCLQTGCALQPVTQCIMDKGVRSGVDIADMGKHVIQREDCVLMGVSLVTMASCAIIPAQIISMEMAAEEFVVSARIM